MEMPGLDMPDQLDIRCPRCGALAVFDEPFVLYTSRGGKPVRWVYHPVPWGSYHTEVVDLSAQTVKTWDGWFVVEKYPKLLPWRAPVGGFYTRGTGVVKCTGCQAAFLHDLTWPDDAYFQWEIRGVTLWAWSRDHARMLLEFVTNADRNPTHYPRYRQSLQRLPKTVLLAKNRDLVIKQISRSLGVDDRPR